MALELTSFGIILLEWVILAVVFVVLGDGGWKR